MHRADQMLAEDERRKVNKIREQQRFELAKAALQGFCAFHGDAVDRTTAEECWRIADAMLATRDAKDRRAAA